MMRGHDSRLAHSDVCTQSLCDAYDVVVVGAGPAGLAAGVAAREAGASRVLAIEREPFVGGVLPQCVHDGFGLHLYGKSLTGPEYAAQWEAEARKAGLDVALQTTVLEVRQVDEGFVVDALGQALGGHVSLRAASVVVATGCRERTRGQMMVPGTRPAGVMTAGTAQYMINVLNQMPGDEAVILGSGDIGLIMARRLTLEGARVRMVLGQAETGLLRNHIRCISDFGLPMREGWGVSRIVGRGQLEGVFVAPFGSGGDFDNDREEFVPCNLLLISCGLIPEREVVGGLFEGQARGLCEGQVPGLCKGRVRGLFICGNANAPHDLVDQVTQEALRAGARAAQFALAKRSREAEALSGDLSRLLKRQVIEPKGRMQDLLAGESGSVEGLIPCTECPSSCMISHIDDGGFKGYGCKRGLAFAMQEVSRPARVFTGTVRVCGGARRLVPVRTTAPVPRDQLIEVAACVSRLHASAPVKLGDVLCRDVAGCDADVVATGDVAAASE